jgi:hypothetical protein
MYAPYNPHFPVLGCFAHPAGSTPNNQSTISMSIAAAFASGFPFRYFVAVYIINPEDNFRLGVTSVNSV